MNHQIRFALAAPILALALTACGGETGDSYAGGRPVDLEGPAPDATDDTGAALGDTLYGDPDAPVQIVEFASWTCGACGYFHRETLPKLKDEFIETGQAYMVVRDYARAPQDLGLSAVARCMGPDRYPVLADHIFKNQARFLKPGGDLVADLALVMREVGMSRTQLDRCLSNRSLQTQILERSQEESETFAITGTPFFLINGKPFQLTGGSDQIDQFREAINEAAGA